MIFEFSDKYFSARAKSEKGIAAVLTIVIIAAATLIMASSASLLGLGELDLGYTSQKGGEAFALADGCMEEVLWRINLDLTYGVGAGQINLSLSNGSCIINITDLGANRRRITILGASGSYNKKIEAEITISAQNVPIIDSWAEKTD